MNMKLNRYEVIGKVCVISGGLVQLNKDQAKSRAHNLQRLDKSYNVFEVLNKLQFKHGEIFGHDGDLRKVPSVELVAGGFDKAPVPDDSPYATMKGMVLVAELDKRGIKFQTKMKVEDRRALLVADDKAKAKAAAKEEAKDDKGNND